VLLVAPTSTPERTVRIAAASRGFVYCVSVTGVTGARTELPADLERLKKLVRIVRCSSCAAPVDLERQAACGYCRAPIAILDPDAVAAALRELDAIAAKRAAVASPEAAAAAVLETARFDRAMRAEQARRPEMGGIDLIGVGLGVLAALLAR